MIYLKVVPSMDKNEGTIEFSLNGEYYSNVNSPKLIHQPKLGDIVFFLLRCIIEPYLSQQILIELYFLLT